MNHEPQDKLLDSQTATLAQHSPLDLPYHTEADANIFDPEIGVKRNLKTCHLTTMSLAGKVSQRCTPENRLLRAWPYRHEGSQRHLTRDCRL